MFIAGSALLRSRNGLLHRAAELRLLLHQYRRWAAYAVVKLGRGELFEAPGMLAFFRKQVQGPMLYRRANLPQRRGSPLGGPCLAESRNPSLKDFGLFRTRVQTTFAKKMVV